MDFHAAMETFAEAWVAANTPTAVNTSDPHTQVFKIFKTIAEIYEDCQYTCQLVACFYFFSNLKLYKMSLVLVYIFLKRLICDF